MDLNEPKASHTDDPAAWLPEEWQKHLDDQPRFRADQVFRWIQRHGVLEPSRMTNLGKPLQHKLSEIALRPAAHLDQVLRARDGTRKLLLNLDRGGRVECVLIPMTRAADADVAAANPDDLEESPANRVTLCVSTQFGCAMACAFCASGQAGLKRGLVASEITAQVHLARTQLQPGEQLTNLVFMGMGEPLHHYDETARALRLLSHSEGASMSLRRITVSTVGLVPRIRQLGQDFQGKVGLAISLHATDDATRDRLIPMNKRYPLRDLMRALHEYPLPRRRRITIEYTLIDGINAAPEQAHQLVHLLKGLPVKVNLIPMNPIAASPMRAPPDADTCRFRDIVAEAGLSCFLRTRRGDEVDAACGQLALQS